MDEYINSFPKEVKDTLNLLRNTIKEEMPQAEETISYKIPAFKLNGKYIVYFAAWKHHISLYPFSSLMEQTLKEASEYKTSGKGTIQFPLDKPLPLSLIRKIVKFLLQENKSKK